jgi:hypothetical protein
LVTSLRIRAYHERRLRRRTIVARFGPDGREIGNISRTCSANNWQKANA